MKIERYRPAFFDMDSAEINDIKSFDELCNIEWVSQWSKYKNFFRYSIDIDKSWELRGHCNPQHSLMCEFKNGAEWRIIAFIREKDITIISNSLPEFNRK